MSITFENQINHVIEPFVNAKEEPSLESLKIQQSFEMAVAQGREVWVEQLMDRPDINAVTRGCFRRAIMLGIDNGHASLVLGLLSSKQFKTIELPWDLHDLLIKLIPACNYKITPEAGLCQGIVMMGMLAALAGDTCSFNQRLNQIFQLFHEHKFNIAKMAEALSKQENPSILTNILPFLDGVTLWHEPVEFPELFTPELRPAYQTDPKSLEFLLSILTPVDLVSKGGVGLVIERSGVYTPSELNDYVQRLQLIFEKHAKHNPVAVTFYNTRHTLGVAYCNKEKSWLLIDSESLPITPIDTNHKLVKHIFEAFDVSPSQNDMLLLSNSVFALNTEATNLSRQIQLEYQAEDFQKVHGITPEKAQMRSPDNDNWLSHAIMQEDIPTIKDLMIAGTSVEDALIKAVFVGSVTSMNYLLEQGLDPNVFSECYEETPLSLSILLNNKEMQQLLLSRGAAHEPLD